jgi:hypothetical protein
MREPPAVTRIDDYLYLIKLFFISFAGDCHANDEQPRVAINFEYAFPTIVGQARG